MDLGRVGIWSTELRYGDPGETRDAGADHVAVHLVSPGPGSPPRALWRQLSEALLG